MQILSHMKIIYSLDIMSLPEQRITVTHGFRSTTMNDNPVGSVAASYNSAVSQVGRVQVRPVLTLPAEVPRHL